MSYAIIRNANYKKDNLAGLYKHNERKNTNYSNKDINKNNSIKNYSIKKCNTTYSNAIKLLQKENDLKGRIIKTTNIVCEFIITSDKDFFDNIGEEETKRYFQLAYDFVASYKNLGEEYILSAKVHMDESTPHLHLVFIPVVHTKDKKGNPIDKIACSEYWKGKDSYKRLQDNFYKYITDNGFNLERGKKRKVEHLSTEKLKQITNYENIKYELSQEEIQPIDITNKDLIIKQNKVLIKYTNKLKVQLSKSYSAINKVEELQQENINLKYENEELKKENYKLKKYIEKTFEVVKNLFSFPIDRFQRIVNNFIQYFEK
ncbi:MAG: plasmid recombination protein [Clostridium sp.]|nr:plasmid recombination protein [Clostridium sp.]